VRQIRTCFTFIYTHRVFRNVIAQLSPNVNLILNHLCLPLEVIRRRNKFRLFALVSWSIFVPLHLRSMLSTKNLKNNLKIYCLIPDILSILIEIFHYLKSTIFLINYDKSYNSYNNPPQKPLLHKLNIILEFFSLSLSAIYCIATPEAERTQCCVCVCS
jgi:hypothetical protein